MKKLIFTLGLGVLISQTTLFAQEGDRLEQLEERVMKLEALAAKLGLGGAGAAGMMPISYSEEWTQK